MSVSSKLISTIQSDLTAALKTRDAVRLNTLRMIQAALKNEQIAKRQPELTDTEALAVLTREAKKRREAVTAYQKGSRPDLVDKEQAELSVIEAYLPKQLSEEEILKAVQIAVADNPGTPMGKIMGLLMPQFKGRADGAVVQRLVKEALSKP